MASWAVAYRVETEIRRYFAAETRASLLFLGTGIAAALFSAALWAAAHPWKWIGIPFVAIGAIQIVVGATVFLRTDAQVAALVAQARKDPPRYRAEETTRMEHVIRSFRTSETVALVVLALGVALVAVSRGRASFLSGGVGCVVQASITLVLDIRAERRASAYLERVRGPHVDA